MPVNASKSAFSSKPSVRVDWDSGHLDHEVDGHTHSSELRRLRLGASGKLGTLDYKAVADLSGLERHHFTRDGIKMRDLWVSQRLGAGTLMLGQFKQAFSLEGSTGSNVGIFMERAAAIEVLAPGYHKAISWQMSGPHTALASSVWKLQKIGAPQFAGYGAGTRFTFAPHLYADNVRHFGLSLAHEYHDHPGTAGAPALRLRPRTGAHLSKAMRPTFAEFSGGGATEVDKWSLEYARVYGAWSWQGEFSGGLMEDGTEEARILAEYGVLSWFVSGHTRRYDAASGRFARLNNVTSSNPGWELALRFEHIHGRQRDHLGMDHLNNSTTAWTLASNWYMSPNFRLMLNFITNFDRDHLVRTQVRSYELIGRMQYDF